MITTKLQTDTWVVASWDEYIETSENPAYQKAKCYYHNGQMRLETTPVCPDHASNHVIILLAIILYCIIKGIAVNGLDNCSYQKTGVREAQPDISYYVGERSHLAPTGSAIVNLDHVPPPDLAIEIDITSRTAFTNYEGLGVPEVWQYNGQRLQINVLQDGKYIESETSGIFSQFCQLSKVIHQKVEESKVVGRNATMKAFRNWVREQL